jgi:hypothetical protein
MGPRPAARMRDRAGGGQLRNAVKLVAAGCALMSVA